jgi:hypothetical protein
MARTGDSINKVRKRRGIRDYSRARKGRDLLTGYVIFP